VRYSLFLRLYLPWCFFVAAATSLLLSASVPENLSCNYIERVKILKEAAVRHSTNHYTYPWSAAFPVVGCVSGPHSPLTYPPLMLPIRRPVQDDLSSPVPVPKPSTSCKRISGINHGSTSHTTSTLLRRLRDVRRLAHDGCPRVGRTET
jgi:hypothetical protein